MPVAPRAASGRLSSVSRASVNTSTLALGLLLPDAARAPPGSAWNFASRVGQLTGPRAVSAVRPHRAANAAGEDSSRRSSAGERGAAQRALRAARRAPRRARCSSACGRLDRVAVQPARGEAAHDRAAVADQPVGEAVGLGEVREQRLAVLELPELARRPGSARAERRPRRPRRPCPRAAPRTAAESSSCRASRARKPASVGAVAGSMSVSSAVVLGRVELHRRGGEQQQAPAVRASASAAAKAFSPLRWCASSMMTRSQSAAAIARLLRCSSLRESSSRLVTTVGSAPRARRSGCSFERAARSGRASISVKSWLNLWNSSASHCTVRWLGATTSTRAASPESRSAREDHARLDGLAQAHLVGEHEARAGAPRAPAAPRRPGAASPSPGEASSAPSAS